LGEWGITGLRGTVVASPKIEVSSALAISARFAGVRTSEV